MYENSGRLFKNDKKQPGDNRPDYTGDFHDASGRKMRVAAWVKDGKQGGKWLSFKVSEMQEQQPAPPQQPGPPQRTAQEDPLGDSEIPF